VSGLLPAAYSYLLSRFRRAFERAGREGELAILEYVRPGWTFHAKGLFIRPAPGVLAPSPGAPQPPSPPSPPPAYMLTTIGSSNYNFRSFRRDLEAQALVVTSDPSLVARVEASRARLLGSAGAPVAHVAGIGREGFEERRPSASLRLVTRLLSKWL
jgi:CDP-diacylglycerol--glycerol-3-phosphate 3-phosphatidyltransferase